MKPYTKEEIRSIYGELLQLAHHEACRKHWEDALLYLEASASWAYHYNYIYTDPDAERLLGNIAKEALPIAQYSKNNERRCVLIDSFCMDNRGLTQQYLRAMFHHEMEILYICTADQIEVGDAILGELNSYPKCRQILFTDVRLTKTEKSKKMIEAISRFAPAHIFLHLTPWDTAALMACHSVKGGCVYNINLTDHAYWLGASLIDYNVEFRSYGKTVSLEKRGLRESQLLVLPYYPITPVTREFKGLPELPQDSVKVFTGGALYKMLGYNNIFFHIMDEVLSIAPNVYILVAGFDPSKCFDEGKKSMRHADRVLEIGMRSDIDAVFEATDIFLGTYPTSGALMAQYAAKHAKPIIAYHDKEDPEGKVEEIVNHYQHSFRSFSEMSNFVGYAKKLITDRSFRQREGEKLQQGLMTETRFAEEFKGMISTHQSSWQLDHDEIDYDAFFEKYMDNENLSNFPATASLVRKLKLKTSRINVRRTDLMKVLGRQVWNTIRR